jgi:hypothetical protein
MADLEFNRQDIESLTQKLAQLWPILSPTERALLLAIFGAAAGNANPPGANQPATLPAASNSAPPLAAGADYKATLANYQQQLLTAYTPGNSFDSMVDGGVAPPKVLRPGCTRNTQASKPEAEDGKRPCTGKAL